MLNGGGQILSELYRVLACAPEKERKGETRVVGDTGYSQAVCRATGQPVYGQGMFWGHYKITLVY